MWQYEKNISTQQLETIQNSWIFGQNELPRRTEGYQQKTGQRKKKAFGLIAGAFIFRNG
jgi:hypothetical protein